MSLVDGPVVTPITTLISADQQIDQNDYSDSVEFDVTPGGGRPISGEIIGITLVSKETGSGAIMIPVGTVFFFDTDPDIDAGDTAATAAAMEKSIGSTILSATTVWKGDASGKVAHVQLDIGFSNAQSIWVCFLNEDATAINSAGGDDELITARLHYLHNA